MGQDETMPIGRREEPQLLGGRYLIVGEIGRGGMSTVYAAEDVRLPGKLRAVKELCRSFAEYEQSAEEAHMLMRLNHPNLPQIVDHIPPDAYGLEYVVMDYVQGETLEQRLQRRGGSMPFEEIASVAIQLCGALAYLHEQSTPIIHRDLKPSNIMIDESGHVRLIDFGIARYYKTGKLEDTLLLGTPGFAAPEQIMGTQSDARTDIYGLGAVLYYLISGGAGFEMFPSGPPVIRNEVPSSFFSAVARMMHTNAELRFQSMRHAEETLIAAVPGGRVVNRLADQRADVNRNTAVTAVLSVSPGAGATFVTMTIARLLEQAGTRVSAFEMTGLANEWFALLGGTHRSASSDDSAAESGFVRLKDIQIDWFCRQEPPTPNKQPRIDAAVRRSVENAAGAGRSVLIDLSSGWDDPQALEWLGRAATIVIVADPNPSRWSVPRLQKLQGELTRARQEGAAVMWVANKDTSFKHRREWLELLPEKPAAIVPLIPYSDLLDMLWSGHWPTDRPDYRKQLERSLIAVTAASSANRRKQ